MNAPSGGPPNTDLGDGLTVRYDGYYTILGFHGNELCLSPVVREALRSWLYGLYDFFRAGEGSTSPIKEDKTMDDDILGQLRLVRAAVLEDPTKSRELSLVLTKIDEAILWRQFDLQIKTPPQNMHNTRPD